MHRAIFVALLLLVPFITPAAGTEFDVFQANKEFSVKTVDAAVGDKLRFVNNDDVVHNVFSISPGYEFDLGFQQPGAVASMMLKKAGRGEFRCAIHPRMKVVVNVK